MAGEHQKFRIEDLIQGGILLINDGYRAKNSELSRNGIPFARAGNVNGGFRFDDADRVPPETLARVGAKRSKPGDVVFTSKGTVGRFAFVRKETPEFVYSPQLCFWRSSDETRIDPRWLYYWMNGYEFFLQYKGVAGQTDMAEYVSLRDQRAMCMTLPPLSEQKAVAHILGTLDDKIELNCRMNETLEAMARALFQSWFVDFDPVRAKLDGRSPAGLDAATAALFPAHFEDSTLGHIPQGWEAAEIGKIGDVIDCLHAKKPERCDIGYPYLQLNNIRDDGLIDITDTYYVSEADYKKWISRMEATVGICVITNVGRVGAVAQIPEGVKAALGRNMTGIRCKAAFQFPTFLLECLLSEALREEIRMKMDTGTILDALNVKNIPKLRFVRPPVQIMARFELVARPLRRKMEQNLSESCTLRTLRDALLPKLLSGELRVKDGLSISAMEEMVYG